MKFTGRVTFKFTLPPFETVIDDRSSIGRYICSSLLLNFTFQVYSSSLPVSFTPTNQAHIYGIPLHQRSFTECTYTLARCTPLQFTIDVWNTITPNKFHISKNAHIPMADRPPCNQPYIHATPLHPISFTYGRMHIYQGQMYPLPSN